MKKITWKIRVKVYGKFTKQNQYKSVWNDEIEKPFHQINKIVWNFIFNERKIDFFTSFYFCEN
jgi:hypothetical protein